VLNDEQTTIMQSNVKMAWGKNADGTLTNIKEANNGKACNCYCLECKSPLIARQGKSGKMKWHFAHASNTLCSGMTVLHYVGQELFLEAAKYNTSLNLPLLSISKQKTIIGTSVEFEKCVPQKRFTIYKAQLEKHLGSNICDVYCQDENGDELYVEIHVTNAKSDDDIKSFRELNVNCIEIDLSELDWGASYEEIKHAVFQNIENTTFLSHKAYSEIEPFFKSALTETKLRLQKEAEQVVLIDKRLACVYSTQFRFFSFNGEIDFLKLKKDIEVVFDTNSLTHKGEATLVEGRANRTASLYIAFCFEESYGKKVVKNLPADIPVLIVIINEEYDDYEYAYHWFRVDKWSKKLKKIGLNERLAEEKKSNRIGVQSKILVQSMDGNQSALIKDLNLQKGHYHSTFSKAWNVDEFSWKAAVLKYKILTFKLDKICLSRIAGCRWLHQHFEFSGLYYEERLDELSDWLQVISERGFIINIDKRSSFLLDEDVSLKDSDIWYYLNKPKFPISKNKTDYYYAID
jgi:hypothetical protein